MATTPPTSVRRRSSTTDLALISTFAAFIAVCAIIPEFSVTGVGVPFTLQMFGIFLTGAVLGARRGFLAVILYLAAGTAGLPIFSGGTGGPSVWTGPTAGYLIAFPLAALILGLIATVVVRFNPAIFTVVVAAAAALLTVGVVGVIGAAGMAIKFDVSLGVAWGYATPFFVADIIKGCAAAVVAAAVHRAFPQLSALR